VEGDAGENEAEQKEQGWSENLVFHGGSWGQTIPVSQKSLPGGKRAREIKGGGAHPRGNNRHRT